MNRIIALLLSALTACAWGQEPATNRTDAVGSSLNTWIAERSAAGFKALNYENRDTGHSIIPADIYRGLTFLHPSEEEKKQGRDKGLAYTVRNVPVIGNCSMAGLADHFGSLPRACMIEDNLHLLLFSQYLKNNLFVYPEHQDHDPGANGKGGGWGDLFPANTPTVLISQGSSLQDLPFVRALLATAAAFRPEVQEFLIQQNLLMPTLQAILRQSNKQVLTESDYFTGKAHPVVFDEKQIDELKMVTLAHTMSLKTVPPLAVVEVLRERPSVPGVDFFESPGVQNEKLGASPVNVARIFRSTSEDYAISLNAGHSLDPMKRPLHYRWEVLQGQKDLIKIETSENGQMATLHVRWHPPFTGVAGIRTHRVDIGLFATNGPCVSAPAIVSIYMLPNERRFFDPKGRLSEICYEAGNPELGLPTVPTDHHWLTFFEAASLATDSLVFKALSQAEREACAKTWSTLAPLKRALDENPNDPTRKESLENALAQIPSHLRDAPKTAINAIADRPDFFVTNQKAILADAPKEVLAELQRLTNWQVLKFEAGAYATVHPAEHLTESDRYYLRQLHLTVLSEVLLPGLFDRSPAPLFVDPRLTTRKSWRDVYRYDAKDARTGWDRYYLGKTYHFDNEGQLLGEDSKPAKVAYKENGGYLNFEVQRSKN